MRAGIFKLKPGLGAGQLLAALEGVAAKYKGRRVGQFLGSLRKFHPGNFMSFKMEMHMTGRGQTAVWYVCVLGALECVAAKYRTRGRTSCAQRKNPFKFPMGS